MSPSWADGVSAVASAAAALLSAVAVLVAVRVARQSGRQTEAIASEQAQREIRSYHADRKSEFREQCRSVLAAANAIETMLNPRVSELISASDSAADVEFTRTALAQLSSEVNLLTTFTDASSGIPSAMAPVVAELLEEAAWLYSDALHLAILERDPDGEDEVSDLRDPQAVVTALLDGSAVNLEPRLMPGYDPASPNGEGPDADAAWRAAYGRREALLLSSGIVTAAPLPSTLSEVAARSLGWISIRRFADRASVILSAWGAAEIVQPDAT
ncbi:hypothetical protein [Curtobacterium citreum]|uniref:DUF4439 domain-containing protein n=1 Tax=Curtobacterium citreum TaxID=2036 RepID=A0ABU8Y7Z4_9MICO